MKQKITTLRFVECIKNWNKLIIKSKDSKMELRGYWCSDPKQEDVFAMFFDFEYKKNKEYVKIYCDNKLSHYPNLRIDVYLLNRGERTGFGVKSDYLVKSFNDFAEFQEFFKNIQEEIKKSLNIIERRLSE